MEKKDLPTEPLQERVFSAEQRKALADKGWALPDGSYPIESKGDLSNAIQAFGRATNKAQVKRHIIKRARALGATDTLPDGWLTEAIQEAVELSWEEVEQRVRRAIADRFAPQPFGYDGEARVAYIPVLATYADRAVYRLDQKAWQIEYSVDDNGTIVLGAEPTEVAMTFERLGESAHTFLEATGSEGREWDVLLIETGLSKNGKYYPADTLKAAVPLFEGTWAFADHASESDRRERPERSIRDKVGRFSEVRYGKWEVGGRTVEGLRARFKVIAPWLRELLVEAHQAQEPEFVGFSIDAEGRVTRKQHGGQTVNWVEAIVSVTSTDVVTDPAAGGRMMRLVASNTTPQGGQDMDPEKLAALVAEQVDKIVEKRVGELSAAVTAGATATTTTLAETKAEIAALKEAGRKRENVDRVDVALKASTLSEAGRGLLRTRLVEAVERRELPDDEITTALQEQVAYEAAFSQQFSNPRGASRLKAGDDQYDTFDKALQGWFSGEPQGEVKPFRTLKEAYCRWNGIDFFDEFDPLDFVDSFGVKYDSHSSHKRIRESLTRSSWGEVFADNLYVMMIRDYREDSVYSAWAKFVSDFEDVPDFQTRHWTRVGGYGDLATVAEQATYPTLTSPTDEEVTYAIAKRGGLDDVTMETLIDGRSGRMRRVPQGMSRSAKRTLYKFVLNLITTDNANMDYDAVALYNSAHGNTGTTALSVAGLDTTQVAMRDQTAYNQSLEILGERNRIKYVIVPNELEARALRILNPSEAYTYALTTTDTATDMDPQRWKGSGIELHVYDVLTDATDWWAVANPAEVPTLVVGFLNGQREPELFIQDSPTVGANFSADKTTFKIRQIYGGDILEHRSFYRQVVA